MEAGSQRPDVRAGGWGLDNPNTLEVYLMSHFPYKYDLCVYITLVFCVRPRTFLKKIISILLNKTSCQRKPFQKIYVKIFRTINIFTFHPIHFFIQVHYLRFIRMFLEIRRLSKTKIKLIKYRIQTFSVAKSA